MARWFAALLPEACIVCTPVPPFASLAAGFCVAELALNPAPPGTLVFHNVAPREDDGSERRANAGERLAYARFPSGVLVVGVNAGFVDSFVRVASTEVGWAAADDSGSQFRSRDLFPQAAAELAWGGGAADPLKPGAIPDIPPGRLAYADGYGNHKLTLTRADVAGKLARPSGWLLPSGGQVEWLELFLRGDNASEAFGRPMPGAEVRVKSRSRA